MCHPRWLLALEGLTNSCCFCPLLSPCLLFFHFKLQFGVWRLVCILLCTGTLTQSASLGLTSAQRTISQRPTLLLGRWVGRGGLLLQKSDLETWALKRGSPARVTLSASLPDLGARHQLAALPQHHLLPRGDQRIRAYCHLRQRIPEQGLHPHQQHRQMVRAPSGRGWAPRRQP